MNNNNSSERHIANNLKVILNFDNFFHPPKKITEIKKDEICSKGTLTDPTVLCSSNIIIDLT